MLAAARPTHHSPQSLAFVSFSHPPQRANPDFAESSPSVCLPLSLVPAESTLGVGYGFDLHGTGPIQRGANPPVIETPTAPASGVNHPPCRECPAIGLAQKHRTLSPSNTPVRGGFLGGAIRGVPPWKVLVVAAACVWARAVWCVPSAPSRRPH